MAIIVSSLKNEYIISTVKKKTMYRMIAKYTQLII